METEYFRLRERRQGFRVFDVRIVVTEFRCEVMATRRELVILVENLVAVVVKKNLLHQFSVVFVRHTTAVVALSGQVPQSFERNSVCVLIDKDMELLHRDTQVCLIESVLDVPAKWAIEASLLNDCVEEAEAKEHLAELLLLSSAVEPFLIIDGIDQE